MFAIDQEILSLLKNILRDSVLKQIPFLLLSFQLHYISLRNEMHNWLLGGGTYLCKCFINQNNAAFLQGSIFDQDCCNRTEIDDDKN